MSALIVTEIGLAVVLVFGAGLMVQSFWRLRTEETGYRPGGVLPLMISPAVRPVHG